LYAHRNLKLLLFLTSGPFFALLFCVKYSLKFGVLYFLYNKKKADDAKKVAAKTLAPLQGQQPDTTNR